MTLKDKINEAIKDAMRQKNQIALQGLRAVKSAILLAETAEGRDPSMPLSQAEEMTLINRQVKQRKDSIAQFEASGRTDLAETERAELAVIEQFLPAQLSETEVEAKLKGIITEIGATSPTDLGKVMKAASAAMAGQADGKIIADLAKKLLQS